MAWKSQGWTYHILIVNIQIVIEKLTKNVTEEHIREIFGAYGDIKFVDMPVNPHCTFIKPFFNVIRNVC